MARTAEAEAREYWRGVLGEDPTSEQIEAELHDYYLCLREVPKVYGELTQGRFTKPTTEAQYILDRVNELENEVIAEAVADATEPPRPGGGSAAAEIAAGLADLQRRIVAWCGETFPGQTAPSILRHLHEETVELTERQTAEEGADCLILLLAWAAHDDVPILTQASPAELALHLRRSATSMAIHAEEPARELRVLGDGWHLLVLLLAWAQASGVDLLAAAQAKHAVNLGRRWRVGADGVHRHID